MADFYLSSERLTARTNLAPESGTFSTGSVPAGWAALAQGSAPSAGGGLSIVASRLRITNGTGTGAGIDNMAGVLTLTGLTIGVRYYMQWDQTSASTGGATCRISDSDNTGQTGTQLRGGSTSNVTWTDQTWVATATTMYLSWTVVSTTDAVFYELDNVIVVPFGTGASWTEAFINFRIGHPLIAAGDTVYVAHDHSETGLSGSAVTYTLPGTAAAPNRVICITRGEVPSELTQAWTAVIATAGNGPLTLAGNFYWTGTNFNCGNGGVTAGIVVAVGYSQTFYGCTLYKRGTSGTATAITIGSSGTNTAGRCTLISSSLAFGSNGDCCATRCELVWKDTAFPFAGTIPTAIFGGSGQLGATRFFEGLNLSDAAGKTLFGSSSPHLSILKDCKIPATLTIGATAAGGRIQLINCYTDDVTRTEKITHQGSEVDERTIVRADGADVARKIVTDTDASWHDPYEMIPLQIWNETVGSPVTVSVEGVWDAAAIPLSNEVWADTEYLGTNGGTLGLAQWSPFFSYEHPASVEDWTTTGLTTPKRFRLEQTVTPQKAGPITVYVKVGKPSATAYICPKISLS
jgi:hypothetical protein